MPVTLQQWDGLYAVAQLPPDAPFPGWITGPGMVTLTRADDELSVVCRQDRIPADGVRVDRDWCCLKLLGPFAFNETGIVLSVIRPLSENGLGIFVVPTFNGDFLLVKAADLPVAETLLTQAGHTVRRITG
ncbi:ACT domain-containing protein [Novispirillum itersonii]|uniref:Aspartate kinase n=1 Tax=Novispirillum itersonii TaxID=189 RepID=A0A7W9ZKB6_NOVIT|nr:ACT domain-containing protein [Novispirillum itersonii]MBB6211779.1 hypothetical protein [Novispirillum itersonii]